MAEMVYKETNIFCYKKLSMATIETLENNGVPNAKGQVVVWRSLIKPWNGQKETRLIGWELI